MSTGGSSGVNTGGATSAGGSNNTGGTANVGGGSGGSVAGACGAALLVRGSNYSSDPHDLSIPVADIMTGGIRTYTTTGNGHTHDITLGDEDFVALRNGEIVRKYVCYAQASFTDHEWVISCADPNIMPTCEGEIGTPGNCPA